LSIDLDGAVEEAYPEMVRLRRDVHRRPELAFQEVRTASLVAERLKALGLEVQTGLSKTGVVGFLKGEGDGKTLLIRADMDGLPIHESGALDFRSQNPGAMHA
jgi:amidohydrolase